MSGSGDDEATRVIYHKAGRPEETVLMPESGSPASQIRAGVSVAGKTGGGSDETVFIPASQEGGEMDGAFDPVVGWLVVVDGPGRGKHCPVYYGQNTIGRGDDMRIRIDFGDHRISREAHAFMIYGDKERKFFIRDNGKSNVVRLNDEMVLQPSEVLDRNLITIGDTTLLFVALCNQNFDWLASDA